MKTTTHLLILAAAFAVVRPGLANTLQVNCDRGETIERALKKAKAGQTIKVHGVCQETLTITIDGLTLDGQGSAVSEGQGADVVTVDGAHRVTLKGFDLRQGRVGLTSKGGASVMLRDTTVKDNLITLNAQPSLRANKCRNCLKTRRTTEITEEKNHRNGDSAAILNSLCAL